MKIYHTIRAFLGIAAVCSILAGCEASGFGDFFGSPQITTYIEEYAVQALIIVGEPVQDIRVMRSLNIDSAFSLEKSAVRDADVRLIEGSRLIPLQYNPVTFTYSSPEPIKPSTTYRFEASFLKLDRQTRLTLRGTTTTPAQIQWLRAPKDTLWYPKDTTRLPTPDSLTISWTPMPGVTDYIFSTECLDTLGYGKYLRPPTDEKNRRIVRFFEASLPRYSEPVRSGIRAVVFTPIIWTAFKWYGVHELRIYAPDVNWANWFRQTNLGQNPRFNYRLGSIEGGVGVFGSASMALHRTFLYKNQP
ncbi:MAG: hypothetical protein MUF71_11730 [Candidatus Kapabacteria bacterium]|jgi:hypothetical protein|nr:hypothetical protein [Candidatus Kapabacteria bacterium]